MEIGREEKNIYQGVTGSMYRKKGRGWTKHADFMLIDVLCMQLAFIVSYIVRFGISNPYTDSDYRILAIAFLFIDFFELLAFILNFSLNFSCFCAILNKII